VGVWRYASTTCGELCVTIYGQVQMLEWLADNWDTQAVVSLTTCTSPFHCFSYTRVSEISVWQGKGRRGGVAFRT